MKINNLCSEITEAISAFRLNGTVTSWTPYGNGHINDTFLVCAEGPSETTRYILQRINHKIFQNPDELMVNISGVTSYLHKIVEKNGGDPFRETLNLIKTQAGDCYYKDSIGCYWRCYLFIEDTICYEKAETTEAFYASGKAFGHFQYLLSDYPAAGLYETIPDFHNTPLRYQSLLAAAEQDIYQRRVHVQDELEFIRQRQAELSQAINMMKTGQLPIRVTHNDTKLNNVLIDSKSGIGICVIDLDTIMPGLSINDFGDAIRFGGNTALEDETDLTRVSLSLPLFAAYTKGFLEGCQGRLNKYEIQMLPMGAKLMTLECGIRFLTDYLQGDVYFKIHRPNHNLDRARNQLKLVRDMETKWESMNEIAGGFL